MKYLGVNNICRTRTLKTTEYWDKLKKTWVNGGLKKLKCWFEILYGNTKDPELSKEFEKQSRKVYILWLQDLL